MKTRGKPCETTRTALRLPPIPPVPHRRPAHVLDCTHSQWWLDATGGHAFSIDGWMWTYTGVAWGDAMSRYNTADGQGAVVEFDEGETFTFTRLERPHLLFANNKAGQLQVCCHAKVAHLN